MVVTLKPATYVVAVSGGVDSISLLHALITNQHPDTKLIVAHFDHGIRDDSVEDRRFVEQIAREYKLPFVFHRDELGPDASEAAARKARYEFLHHVRRNSGARAVVTAHHQDDLLETAIHNLMRGTGRRGLSSLKSTDEVFRPLLYVPKADLQRYAKVHNLKWREDSSNKDLKYTRNKIRHTIMPKLTPDQRLQFLSLIDELRYKNEEIEGHLINHLHVHLEGDSLNRKWFTQLPHNVSREVIHAWLRRHKIKNIDRKTLERLVVAAKTFPSGQRTDIDGKHKLRMEKQKLVLVSSSR